MASGRWRVETTESETGGWRDRATEYGTGSLSHGIRYGTSIALLIQSLDPNRSFDR